MTYQALYRVWRPQTFKDVYGQEMIAQTLQNAIRKKQPSHAYLFTGPRGTGKTSVAKIFAKAINCQHPVDGEPCNECAICQQITEGSLGDVIEIDAASNNGVEEIRDIREKANYARSEERRVGKEGRKGRRRELVNKLITEKVEIEVISEHTDRTSIMKEE